MESNMRRRGSPPVESTKPSPDTFDDSSLLQTAAARVLLLYDDLPEWAKDNEHILSGWRPETNSYCKSFKSMTYIHNESGNIYIRLFAALWMVELGSWWSGYANKWYPATNSDDAIVFFLFFLGGIVWYLLSTAYHVFSNDCHTTHLFCLKLDFLCILVVTAGCFPPGLWYTFPCASREVKFTWITVSVIYLFLSFRTSK
jgi:adiponectin receptor